jgi:hypothetical protein
MAIESLRRRSMIGLGTMPSFKRKSFMNFQSGISRTEKKLTTSIGVHFFLSDGSVWRELEGWYGSVSVGVWEQLHSKLID